MSLRTFSPIILNKNPVEPPKVIKQDNSLKPYTNMKQSKENDSDTEDNNSEEDEEEEEEEWSDKSQEQEEILNDFRIIKKPVVVTKRSSTPPLIPTYLTPSLKNTLSSSSSSSSSFNATDYMNKMTLDLMMNPQYLSKANPEAFQRKVEQAQRILKHRREIYKKMDECFDALNNLTSGNGHDDMDLDIQTGFLHFAKTVLLNIQQQHAGKSGEEPIFSVCNDIYSSFYPDEDI